MKSSNSVAGKRSWNLLGNKFDQLFADFFRNIGNTLNSKLLLSEDEKALLAFGSTGMQPCANPHRLSSQFFGQDSKIVNEMQTGFTLRLIHLSNSILANGHVHLTIRKDQFEFQYYLKLPSDVDYSWKIAKIGILKFWNFHEKNLVKMKGVLYYVA